MGKADKTRQFIIEKAASLFNQKGFNGTSMSDIMEATGLSKGGIYGSFRRTGLDKNGVKEEIAVAAFEHAVQQVYAEISQRTAVIDNTLDKLKTVVYFYKERIFTPPVEGGCPIQNTSVEADDANPALRAKAVEAIEMWRSRIKRTLEKGIEKGEVRSDVNKEEFSTYFIGMLQGGILLSRIQRNVSSFDVMTKPLLEAIDRLRP